MAGRGAPGRRAIRALCALLEAGPRGLAYGDLCLAAADPDDPGVSEKVGRRLLDALEAAGVELRRGRGPGARVALTDQARAELTRLILPPDLRAALARTTTGEAA